MWRRAARAIARRRWTYRWLVAPVLPFIAHDARTGGLDDFYYRHGFLPLPRHFYYPVPDTEDLERRDHWSRRSSLDGVAWDLEKALASWRSLGERFGDECRWPVHPSEDPNEFYTDNDSFSFGCAASTYMMVRNARPKLVIEIGSGKSSKVIAQALHVNGRGRHIIVDPYPSADVTGGLRGDTTVVAERVETQDLELFDQLEAGDILFIDSSHVSRIGGDVNYEILEVLPRLAEGVVVHVHDICLPYEYHRTYATGSFRYLWTEQYMLQAFLALNTDYEVLLPMYEIQTDHPAEFAAAIPHYDPEVHKLVTTSFWMMRTHKEIADRD